MAGLSIRVIDNTALVKAASEAQIKRALTVMAETAEGYAKLNCKKFKHPTGRLANSITHSIDTDGKKAYIGTNVVYAPYVEFGTGIHSELGGRKTPWSYQDEIGNWWRTNGQKPHPYLRPAIVDHVSEYKEIAETELRS